MVGPILMSSGCVIAIERTDGVIAELASGEARNGIHHAISPICEHAYLGSGRGWWVFVVNRRRWVARP